MNKQKGFTFWSMTFTIGVIVIVALLTIKLFPAYAEFFAIKKAINKLSDGGNLSNMDKREIQRAFEMSSNIDDFKSVKPTDLKIGRTSSGDTTVTADYEVVIPLVANISALLTFHASTDDAALARSKIGP
jgi:Tfp pilus assembly major pilin PilA